MMRSLEISPYLLGISSMLGTRNHWIAPCTEIRHQMGRIPKEEKVFWMSLKPRSLLGPCHDKEAQQIIRVTLSKKKGKTDLNFQLRIQTF